MKTLLQHVATFLVAYGPIGVLLLSAIDSMGVPLPAVVDALVLGVAADNARTPSLAWLTALLAVIGSTVGNIVLFMGVRHGRRMVRRNEAAEAVPGRFQMWFHRYGLVTVFIPAVVPFLPLPLKVFVISAGAFRTPVSRFVAVIVLARAVRFFGEAWLGLQLGRDAQGFLIRNGWTLAGVFLILALAAVVLLRRMARAEGGASGDRATPL